MRHWDFSYWFVKTLLKRSFKQFYRHDHYFMEHDLNERTMTDSLASYIRPQIRLWYRFHSYNTDCEYNRNMDEPKRGHYYNEMYNRPSENGDPILIPDIIVHKRGSNEHNLIVIEAKKVGARQQDINYDFMKLEYMTSPYSEYHFKYGFWVEIAPRQVEVVSFREGSEYKRYFWRMRH